MRSGAGLWKRSTRPEVRELLAVYGVKVSYGGLRFEAGPKGCDEVLELYDLRGLRVRRIEFMILGVGGAS